jgi:putative glutamine amidotransferase
MARPLIAVSAPREPLPTAFGTMDCTKLTAQYTDAIYEAGGQPVILPVAEEIPAQLMARMDGLLLTGGGDLDPALYGEEPDQSVYGVRKDRDAFETQLYREAMQIGLPILALCRGLQLVNVLRGGSLHQAIEGHWQTEPASVAVQEIDVAPDSKLAEAVGITEAVHVNSYHHQGIRALGLGLAVTAVCDGVIEAVEATDADIVAVQWHPEHLQAADRGQRALFEAFVKRAGAAARKTTS